MWILITHIAYEGGTFRGIFESKERAKEVLSKLDGHDKVTIKKVKLNEELDIWV